MSLKKLLALRAFAMDYHSGQWSRGYKILSMTSLRIEKHKDKPNTWEMYDRMIENARKTKLYKTLVERYGDKI